jgi:nitrite reductase (NO-forming)
LPGVGIEDRRRGRVVASHRIAVTALRLAGLFGTIAVAWGLRVVIVGGSWWGPVHAFLLGAVTLAIAGAAQMFTITWSAAPAPPAWIAAAQRWVHAVGAGLVLAGVTGRTVGVTVVGGVAVLAGLGLLAFSLIGAIRHSLLRRFDLSARFYLLGLGCAVVGVVLGVLMTAGLTGTRYPVFRVVHGHLNLVGFVGFTIIGTIPTLLPTFARHRAVSGREAILGWRMAGAAAAAMMAGLLVGEWAVAVGSLLAAGALAVVVTGVVVRLGRTGLRGGLAYVQVVAGCVWLVAWAAVDASRLLTASGGAAFDQWIAAAVLGGVGQVLLGSLAYLIPVLVGPGPALGASLARFDRRRWLPLVAANVAAVTVLVGAPGVVVPLVGLWLADFAGRTIAVVRPRRGNS